MTTPRIIKEKFMDLFLTTDRFDTRQSLSKAGNIFTKSIHISEILKLKNVSYSRIF